MGIDVSVKILIGCEQSGVTRRAFRDADFDAWSCDILPAEDGSPFHFQCDVRTILDKNWTLGIFHPDCTYLTLAGARWYFDPRPEYADRRERQREAIEFFRTLQNAPIPHICVENPQPLGIVMEQVGRYDQRVQPWEHGTPESKGLCLWLKDLPPLLPTNIVPKHLIKQSCWRMGPGENRKRDRARSFPTVAAQMVAQWRHLL